MITLIWHYFQYFLDTKANFERLKVELFPKKPYLFFLSALEQMDERNLDVLGETSRKSVALAKLMTGLADDGIDDIQPGDFVLRCALRKRVEK